MTTIEGATPGEGAVPFNEPVSKYVKVGERLTATFEPEQRVTTFVLPIVAVSKQTSTSYTVKLDDSTVYGPAPVPPTDVDDLQQTFYPPRRFSQSMTVIVDNVGGSDAEYAIQPVGWEEGH